MSSETNAQHQPGYEPHPEDEAHGSFRGYMTGFVLSVILTAIPFWLVMSGALGNNQLTGAATLSKAVTAGAPPPAAAASRRLTSWPSARPGGGIAAA